MLPLLLTCAPSSLKDCKLDLKLIATHARNAEFNPKKFAAVIMRIREPRTTGKCTNHTIIAHCTILMCFPRPSSLPAHLSAPLRASSLLVSITIPIPIPIPILNRHPHVFLRRSNKKKNLYYVW